MIEFLKYKAVFLKEPVNKYVMLFNIISSERGYLMREILNFNYDYSKCMAMKLGMAYPEKKIPNKSHILLTFEDALKYIKR